MIKEYNALTEINYIQLNLKVYNLDHTMAFHSTEGSNYGSNSVMMLLDFNSDTSVFQEFTWKMTKNLKHLGGDANPTILLLPRYYHIMSRAL